MEKAYIYDKHGVSEYPASTSKALEADVALYNRGRPESEHRQLLVTDQFPPIGQKLQAGRLVDLSGAEQVQQGLIELAENQKLVNGEIVPKTQKELVTAGIMSVSDYRMDCINRLNQLYKNAMGQILGNYPDEETKGWEDKAAESMEWLAADATERETLKTTLGIVLEAQQEFAAKTIDGSDFSDVDIDSFAQSVVDNAALYRRYYNFATGMKNGYRKRIQSLPTTNKAAFYDAAEQALAEIAFPAPTEI